jgi:hypothetical protein
MFLYRNEGSGVFTKITTGEIVKMAEHPVLRGDMI